MQVWINMIKRKTKVCAFVAEKFSIIYGHTMLTNAGVKCYLTVLHLVLTQLFCQSNALWAQELV